MPRNHERKLWATSAAALLIGLLGAAEVASAGGRNCVPGRLAPSRIVIAQPHKGERPLLVEGQVVQTDGKTPAAGVVVYVFHTDASGVYNQRGERNASPDVVERAASLLADRGINAKRGAPPRLRGWVRTDAQGRYVYRTIRPAPYPGGREAAHVHTQLWSYEVPAQWGTSLLFADDPLVAAAERRKSAALGRFAYVCAPKRDAQGVQHCRHDLRLKRRGDDFEGHDRHGFVGAPGGVSGATAAGGR